MHLRRALLLFAIVLALAAIAASVSREDPGVRAERSERSVPQSGSESQGRSEESPTVSPGPAVEAGLREVDFVAADDGTRRLPGGAATVRVEVEEPGEVQIAGLGLSAPADPLTPAVFEVFETESGRYEISFTPADGNEPRDAGTLVVGGARE